MASAGWELYYYPGFPGRAEFVRLLFEEAGVPYVEKGSTREEILKWIIEGELEGAPHFAPPVIKKGDFTLSQTGTICAYLGKQYGLYPEKEEDQWRASQLNMSCHDYIAEGRLAFHGKDPVASYYIQIEYTQPYVDRFIKERLPRHMKYFERALKYHNNGQGFLVGDKLTYVDLALLHILRVTAVQFSDAWNSMDYIPTLKAFKERLEARPNLSAYFKSDRCQPFCGMSVAFIRKSGKPVNTNKRCIWSGINSAPCDLNCDKSLPLPDDPEERDLGDIVLGVQYIHSHCQKQGVPLQYMLPVMVTHGLCHLVGHDHETEEQWQKMIKKELYILEQFNKMTGYTCTPLVDVGH